MASYELEISVLAENLAYAHSEVRWSDLALSDQSKWLRVAEFVFEREAGLFYKGAVDRSRRRLLARLTAHNQSN